MKMQLNGRRRANHTEGEVQEEELHVVKLFLFFDFSGVYDETCGGEPFLILKSGQVGPMIKLIGE